MAVQKNNVPLLKRIDDLEKILEELVDRVDSLMWDVSTVQQTLTNIRDDVDSYLYDEETEDED